MSIIFVNVVGVPISQGSLVGNPRYGGLRYSNDALLKEWRSKVINELAEATPDNWDADKPMNVVAEFRFVRPKGHYGKKGLRDSAPKEKTTKPDLDKITRGIGDCIEQSGIARNDSQIVYWIVSKKYAKENEPPGVKITVQPAR